MPELYYNKSIRELLDSIAKLSPQAGPVELICMWFDDLYRPDDTPPPNYSPEVWARGLREWQECFNSDELAILADFHRVYEIEVEMLPTVQPGWSEDPGWLRVSKAAQAALVALSKCRRGPDR